MVKTIMKLYGKHVIGFFYTTVAIPGYFALLDLSLPDLPVHMLQDVNIFGKALMSVASVVYTMLVVNHKWKSDSIKRDLQSEEARGKKIENDFREQEFNSKYGSKSVDIF